MGSHWLDPFKQLSTKLAKSADGKYFSPEVKNIKHDRYFPQEIKSSQKLSAHKINMLR
jgi:hypothetical protein